MKTWSAAIICLIALALGACAKADLREGLIQQFPIRDLDGVLTQSGLKFDPGITSDGNGSIRVDADAPTTIRLYDVEPAKVEDTRLVYRAHLRTEDVRGQVYLEMWCAFPGAGEFFSRALHAPLTGTTEWTTQETPFFLKKGEVPNLVRLNLVITGPGTVWIDDLTLARSAS
jgi:hypothetical protein